MEKFKISFILMLGILLFQFNVVKADELKIHAIECSVQGDSTLLESNGQYLLMDTCVKQDGNQVLKYLDDHKVTNFDLYLSHYHGDHYGLIMDILNNSKYTIKNIYLPEYNKNDSLINQINTIANQKNITITYLKKGSEFNFEKAKINIIGPLEGTENLENKINNNSLVAKIKIDNTTFLTAGDIEKEQEKLLLKNNIDLKADIMKLSHHGGKTSNTTDFIKAVNPKYTYFSFFGEEEKNNFASDSWVNTTIANVNNITNVLSTGYNGNIIYDINDDEINITPTRNYLTASINYLDYDNDNIIKTVKIPFVKNTKLYYERTVIPNYQFFGDDNLLGKTLTNNQEINLYYLNTNRQNASTYLIPKPIANEIEDENEEANDEEAIEVNNKCTEVNGIYYGRDGSIVTKDEYYTDCGVVDNPKTGHILPLILLLGLLILGSSIYILVNKYSKKYQI